MRKAPTPPIHLQIEGVNRDSGCGVGRGTDPTRMWRGKNPIITPSLRAPRRKNDRPRLAVSICGFGELEERGRGGEDWKATYRLGWS